MDTHLVLYTTGRFQSSSAHNRWPAVCLNKRHTKLPAPNNSKTALCTLHQPASQSVCHISPNPPNRPLFVAPSPFEAQHTHTHAEHRALSLAVSLSKLCWKNGFQECNRRLKRHSKSFRVQLPCCTFRLISLSSIMRDTF